MTTVLMTYMDGEGANADTVAAAGATVPERAFTCYSRMVHLAENANPAHVNTIVHNFALHASGPIPTNHYTVQMIPRSSLFAVGACAHPRVVAKLPSTVLIEATLGGLNTSWDIVVRATHSASR